jgi:hypothetical protein
MKVPRGTRGVVYATEIKGLLDQVPLQAFVAMCQENMMITPGVCEVIEDLSVYWRSLVIGFQMVNSPGHVFASDLLFPVNNKDSAVVDCCFSMDNLRSALVGMLSLEYLTAVYPDTLELLAEAVPHIADNSHPDVEKLLSQHSKLQYMLPQLTDNKNLELTSKHLKDATSLLERLGIGRLLPSQGSLEEYQRLCEELGNPDLTKVQLDAIRDRMGEMGEVALQTPKASNNIHVCEGGWCSECMGL